MTGRTISHFRVLAKLGEGGMGVVYKAEDAKLRRVVALKFLPGDDPELKRRFVEEARAAAALHHPNICTVFEIDEEQGFLAMEYVEGHTLRDQIAQRPLKLEEALRIAVEIGRALQTAHEKGIVHRDIKPANVMVTGRGDVKVMDFGLARILDRTRITRTGVTLGTPAYMSPEQALGELADRRADIWSLGVVLYEMVSGHAPFRGETEASVARAILDDEPEPLTSVRTDVPVELDRIVAKALRKSPGDRYQHVEDLLVDLRRVGVPNPQTRSRVRGGVTPWVWAIAGLVLGAAAMWMIGGRQSPAGARGNAEAISIVQLTTYGGNEREPAISPDGRYFAFVSNHQGQPDIYVRQVSGGDPVRITNDAAEERQLTYSPDGESIYYVVGTGAVRGVPGSGFVSSIWVVGALGGTARRIVEGARWPSLSQDGKRLAYYRQEQIEVAEAEGASARSIYKSANVSAAAISPDGSMVALAEGVIFSVGDLHVVNVADGRKLPVTKFPSGGVYTLAWLPGGEELVYSRAAWEPWPLADTLDLGIANLASGVSRKISLNVNSRLTAPSVSSDGKRMVATAETFQRELWRVPLNGDPKANGRAAVKLVDSPVFPLWQDISRDGTKLIYNSPAAGRRNFWVLPLSPPGPPRQLSMFTSGMATHAAWSPDGSEIVYSLIEGGSADLYVMSASGGQARRLTNDAWTDLYPTWSPDGKWIAFASNRDGPLQLWKVPPSGGSPRKLTQNGGYRSDWSPDGSRIVYSASTGDMWIADGETGAVIGAVKLAGTPSWSPDGKRIAIVQDGVGTIWVHDVKTGDVRAAVEFPPDFHFVFKVSWADAQSLVVNRQELRSNIVLVENFR